MEDAGYYVTINRGDTVTDDGRFPPYNIGRVSAIIYEWQGDYEVAIDVQVTYHRLMKEWYDPRNLTNIGANKWQAQ